jgi:hypothetical protein
MKIKTRMKICTLSGIWKRMPVYQSVDPSSTAKAHREAWGPIRRSPAGDEPGLFIGPSTNPELAQIARQTASRGASKSASTEPKPHG